MILNDTYRMIRTMVTFRAIMIDKKMLTFFEFPRSNTASILLVVDKNHYYRHIMNEKTLKEEYSKRVVLHS
jgi:hypothetical protein